MQVFTLSIWENFGWGLIYFDQFTSLLVARIKRVKIP